VLEVYFWGARMLGWLRPPWFDWLEGVGALLINDLI